MVCASGSGGGTVDNVGEDDERDARESSAWEAVESR